VRAARSGERDRRAFFREARGAANRLRSPRRCSGTFAENERRHARCEVIGARLEEPHRKTMIHEKMTRRTVLTVLGSAAFVTPLVAACSGGGGNKCEDTSSLTPAELQMRQTLQYTASSPHADKRCENCQPFTAGPDPQSCGSCVIVKGPIDPKGYCNSWAARPA
jgi:hypothetical protein